MRQIIFCVRHVNRQYLKTNYSSIWFYLHHQAHLWGILLVLVGLSTVTITYMGFEQYSIMHSSTKVIFFLFNDTNNLIVSTMPFYLNANHSNIQFYSVVHYEAQTWGVL